MANGLAFKDAGIRQMAFEGKLVVWDKTAFFEEVWLLRWKTVMSEQASHGAFLDTHSSFFMRVVIFVESNGNNDSWELVKVGGGWPCNRRLEFKPNFLLDSIVGFWWLWRWAGKSRGVGMTLSSPSSWRSKVNVDYLSLVRRNHLAKKVPMLSQPRAPS